MTRAPVTPHCRASVTIISRRLAEELVARAFDETNALPLADRIALMKLVLAVDVEASRRVGLNTMTSEERDALTEVLGEMQRGVGCRKKAGDPMMKTNARRGGKTHGWQA